MHVQTYPTTVTNLKHNDTNILNYKLASHGCVRRFSSIAMAKFLEEFGGTDFKDLLHDEISHASTLLAAAEPTLPPWRDAAPPNPAEEDRCLQQMQDEEDERTLQLMMQDDDMQDQEQATKHAAADPEQDAPQQVPSRTQHAAAGSGHAPQDLDQATEAARLRALHLYRAAEAAVALAAASTDTPAYSAAEAQIAREYGTRWQDRGPRGDTAPMTWRGQQWRQNSGRYGTRGGDPERNRFFAEQATKRKQREEGKQDKGRGKSKVKGKGKSKGIDRPDRFLVFTNTLLQ